MADADGNFEYALKLLDEQQFPEAIEAFSEFIALCPESEGAYGNRGVARMQTGDDEGALADFRMVTELNPDDAQGYAMMAEAYRNLGKYEDCLSCLAEALEIDPEEENALALRGWLFYRAGQYDCAEEDLESFLVDAEEPGESEDLLRLCRLFLGHEVPEDVDSDNPEDVSAYQAELGLSLDFSEHPQYAEDGLFCSYAHCLRNMPRRGKSAPGKCVLADYECPGGFEQVLQCRACPPAEE